MTESPIPHGRIDTQIDQFIASPDIPWYSLSMADYDNYIYAPQTNPISAKYLEIAIKDTMQIKRTDTAILPQIRERNKNLLDGNDTIVVVLDGRVKDAPDGYLGDIIETSRIINPLLDSGKKIILATPHTELFGDIAENVEVVEIPNGIPGTPHYPWNEELLEFLGGLANQDNNPLPILFPLSGSLPMLVTLDTEGNITNNENIEYFKEIFNPQGNKHYVDSKRWANKGYHQIQAIQAMAYLIGIDNAQNWEQIPEAYLKPTPASQYIAERVAQEYNCFDCPNGGIPMYIHVGVAATEKKEKFKYYPEKKWLGIIDQIAQQNLPIENITMMKPIDTRQAKTTVRIGEYAKTRGFNVSMIPMDEVAEQFDWTFGAFVSLLQKLSGQNGIIVGCDSMPAGHAGPATENKSVVIGNYQYPPGFYCPPENASIVLPRISKKGEVKYTSDVESEQVVAAIKMQCDK